MVIEDERGQNLEELSSGLPPVDVARGMPWNEFVLTSVELESAATHFTLKNDLVHHLWAMKDD
jgi:hypothetical protein